MDELGNVYILEGEAHPPLRAEPVDVTTPEDTAVTVTLSSSGGDGAVQFEVVGQPARGVLSGSGAALLYTPLENFNGVDQFTFKVRRGTEEDTAIATVTVSPVNDPPVVLVHSPQRVTLGGALTLSANAQDVEDVVLAWQWDLDGDGQYETNAMAPVFTAGSPGTHRVGVRVLDTGGLTATATLKCGGRLRDLPAVSPGPRCAAGGDNSTASAALRRRRSECVEREGHGAGAGRRAAIG